MPAASPAAARDSLELPGTTYRASVTSAENQADGPSAMATVSANGRWVVFISNAANLGANPAVGPAVILRDRIAGTTTTVFASRSAGFTTVGGTSNVQVEDPTISGDGRWVAFVASSGPAAGAIGMRTIGLWDRTTREVSALPLPAVTEGPSWQVDSPSLSFDGRYVAFRTDDGLAGNDTNEYSDVYVMDRSTAAFERVSVASSGTQGLRGDSTEPSISPDGRYVAFTSTAMRLVDVETTPKISQVYLHDRQAGSTVLVSRRPDGQAGTGASSAPSVSRDGRVVAFTSLAGDLVAGDGNATRDVFAWTAADGNVVRASVSTEGAQGDGSSVGGVVSSDGRSVAFASAASNLVPDDTNGAVAALVRLPAYDVFVHDLVRGGTTRVSIGNGPKQADGSSTRPSISATGRYVAFDSSAANLVRRDTNGALDVFVRDREPAVRLAESPTSFGTVLIGTPGTSRTITATSSGSSALEVQGVELGGAAAADFLVAADSCTGATVYPGDTCSVQVVFLAPTVGARSARARFTDSAPSSPQDVPLRAEVPKPTLQLDPLVGPPGTVVLATGTGFTPGATVDLAWSAGITPTPLAPIVAGADGTLSAQALVLPRDDPGERDLRATVTLSGIKFPTPRAPFLVVAGSGTPPVSGVIQVFADSLGVPIILRR